MIGSAVGRAVCAMPLPSFNPADYPQQLADKRQTEAKRDWDRQKARLLKQNSRD